MHVATRALFQRLMHPCDLELLVYFSRHPACVLTRTDLAHAVGHDVRQITASLDGLAAAKLLRYSQAASSTAQAPVESYRLTPGLWTEVLPALLRLASSAEGRQRLYQALQF